MTATERRAARLDWSDRVEQSARNVLAAGVGSRFRARDAIRKARASDCPDIWMDRARDNVRASLRRMALWFEYSSLADTIMASAHKVR
jgi:hypothetical protein